MKKEYASAVRKAKTQAKDSVPIKAAPSMPKADNRKNEDAQAESSQRTKISVNVGDISISIDQSGKQSASKKKSMPESKSVSKPPPAKSRKGTDPPATPPAKPTAREAEPKDSNKSKAKTAKTAKSKASKDDDEDKTSSSAPVSKSKPTPTRSEPKVKIAPKLKPDPDVTPARKVKREPNIKAERYDNEDAPMDESEHSDDPRITGVYNIYSSKIDEELPEYSANLRLFLCVDGDTIWGGFDLANKVGVLRIDGHDHPSSLSFGWRSRDIWNDGRLSFGRGCFGDIEFFGDNQVAGTFLNLFDEPLVFEGERRPGPLWCGRSAYSFKQEWDAFVAEAYGR